MDIDSLKIDNFTLSSSSEVDSTISKIKKLHIEYSLIHIASYIHNTVLAQSLKSRLHELFPKAKIVFIKSEDKTQTVTTLFSTPNLSDEIDVENSIINALLTKYKRLHVDLKSCKTNLLSRYFSDDLTHLPNIYQLRKDLHDNDDAGLVILNIDNFKTINNFYGFNIGDYVIEQVSQKIRETFSSYKIYRVSVDEFALILDNSLGFYDLKDFLNELYSSLKNLFVEYQNSKIFINFTLASCSNSSNSEIFSKVAMALKYAKQRGLEFWIYEDRMQFENEYANNLQLSNMVRYAVENLQIVPYFQPIIENSSSKIVKYEALARLIDENGSVISPFLFIPIAKQIKVYNLVTKLVIDKTFETFKDNELEFNINLSIEDIMSNEIFEFIMQKLKASNSSKRVTFELLESEAIQDFQKVARFINEVKRYGAKIAIDDFGSGYSNFSYLTKMSVDYIKIDGSLIKDIDTDKSASLVVETIVDFAKKLGIKTVAEFVHSSTVMTKIKELGIDYSQGFYIDEPAISLKDTDESK